MRQPHQNTDLPDTHLVGDLPLPAQAKGMVVIVHGSGSSRLSPRNQQVALYLSEHGLATLLFDLLTEPEQRIDRITCEMLFNNPMLAHRLAGVLDWIASKPGLRHLQVGLFGASTGAAATILAAIQRPTIPPRAGFGSSPTARARASYRPVCQASCRRRLFPPTAPHHQQQACAVC